MTGRRRQSELQHRTVLAAVAALALVATLLPSGAVRAAPGEPSQGPAPSHQGLHGPIGGGAHVCDPDADDCCGLGAMQLTARAAAAMRSRPGILHQLTVARVPGTPPHPAVAGEALARLRVGADAGAVALRTGLTLRRHVARIGEADVAIASFARPSGGDPAEVAAQLARDPDVIAAGPNWAARTAAAPPNDELFPLQAGAREVSTLEAWDLSLGDGALVAVLDTGIDGAHADLSGALATPGGFVDIVNGGFVPFDDNGHGTAVAGVIAARANDGTGTAGVAPLARILAVKVADRDGVASYADLAAGIAEAVRRGARVINISLGAARHDAALEAAVDAARQAGALVIAAAGNENLGAPLFPAAYPGVLAVGGSGTRPLGPLGAPGAFASAPTSPAEVAFVTVLAPSLALLAPCEKVIAPLPGGVHGFVNGTSVAAAHVAGVAALVLAHRPGTTRESLDRILRQSATPVPVLDGLEECMAFGRVDARRALDRDAPGALDLAVLGWSLAPLEPEAGEPAVLSVRVQNQGDARVQQATLRAQYYLPTSPLALEIAPVIVGPLAPGEVRAISIPWTAARMPAAGPVDVEAALNALAGEVETTDNAVRRRATIVPAAAAALAARDLRVVRMEARHDRVAGLSGGAPAGVVVEAVVRNLGAQLESDADVTFLAGGVSFAKARISLSVGADASVKALWPYAAGASDVVEFTVRAEPLAREARVDDNEAAARVRLGASGTAPVAPLYQQGSDVDLISDAPYRIAGGRPYVPLLLFAPSKADTDTGTFVDFRNVEVIWRRDARPGTPGTTIYKDRTGAAPTVAGPGITAWDELGARQGTLDAFQDQRLTRNGRHMVLRLPTALFGLGALPDERFLDVRMDWSFHRRIFWIVSVARSGSNKKVMRLGFADGPLAGLPGDNHFYDAHFHSIAEWYFSSFTQIFAPRKAYGGPLLMAAESAYAIGMVDDPADVKDLLATTDHNAFFNETVGNPDADDRRPPFGPTSVGASGGVREFARYRELLGLSAGEEVCVEAVQTFSAGPVSVGIPLGAHMVAYRGEHVEGPWHGGGFLPDPSAPNILVLLEQVLATWAQRNQPVNAEAFGYAAHPFSLGLGWPESHRRLAFGLDPANRTLDHVHASPPGFVMKGFQLFNGRGARSLPASSIDFENLNPWIDATWQAGNPGWDGTLGGGLTYWHGVVSDVMRYAFTSDPDGVFVRKVFIAGGSDAHGDFNYDISRLATPISFAQTFSVGSSPFGSVLTYVMADGAAGATRGERLMRAFSSGRSVATDGPVVRFTLDGEGRFDAQRLVWHDGLDQAEDDDGRMGGGGAFDGEGTALVRRGGESAWIRYAWGEASDLGAGGVRAIHIYRDRESAPNPTRRQGSQDVPRAVGSLLVTGTAGALLSERLDPQEEGLVTAPTAFSLGAFTGGDPDVAPLGPDDRRAYSNPLWALPVDVSVRATPSGAGATLALAPGALTITLDFPISMSPTSGTGAPGSAVELKPLDAQGDSTDGTAPGIPLAGTWSRHGGARDARLTLVNTQSVPLTGAAYPSAGTHSFVAYFRDPPRDLFGNPLNRFAFRIEVNPSGAGGATAPPATAGGGASAGGSGGGGGCVAGTPAGGGGPGGVLDALLRFLSAWGPISFIALLTRSRRLFARTT